MSNAQISCLLLQIIEDVQALPGAAVPLVGALISLQDGLPPWLRDFIMAQLSARADLSEVSPAAEAMMRLSAFSAYGDMEFAKVEIQLQIELLKAFAMDDKVLVAAAFMSRLAERLLTAVNQSGNQAPL
ncbi:MAG: hypothetical protein ABIQ90_12615 [Polaromonas sp.]